MLGESLNQQTTVESLIDDVVQEHHDVAHLIINREVDDLEVVLGIEHVQVFNHFLVGDVALAERGCLIEDGEGITHTAISLFCNHSQRLFLEGDTFLLSHVLQMIHRVADGHTFEVIDLTTAQDGRQDLMLLSGGQDEDYVCRGLLQGLQEGVEGCCREHMHLVDDKHFVSAQLRRDAGLFHQGLDVLYRVVRGSIKFEDVQ